MNAPAFTLPNTESPELQREATFVLAEAQALTVTDAQTYGLAAERVKGLRSLGKRIEEWFKPLVEQAHRIHRELTTRRGDALKPIEAECNRLTREMAVWKGEQDRQAREEAARQAREEQERQRQIALEEAATLEAQGLQAEAEAVVEQAIAMPAPVVPVVSVPKHEGISHRSIWRHEVVDPSRVPREYMCIDEAKIAAVVKATKGTLTIPGVRVWEDQITVVRSA